MERTKSVNELKNLVLTESYSVTEFDIRTGKISVRVSGSDIVHRYSRGDTNYAQISGSVRRLAREVETAFKEAKHGNKYVFAGKDFEIRTCVPSPFC